MKVSKIMFAFLILIVPFATMAQKPVIYTTDIGAVDGYDVVAYFNEGKPVLGKKELSFQWEGALWLFSSQKNLDAFKANPESYVPMYGGYCAFGMSRGYKASTKPDAWTIVNGKLYLNYNTDVMKDWRTNQKEFIEKADKNWPEVKKQ